MLTLYRISMPPPKCAYSAGYRRGSYYPSGYQIWPCPTVCYQPWQEWCTRHAFYCM